MYLTTLFILAGLNFGITATYLCTRKINYPFWVYLSAALFCWWPLVIFPIQFYAEKRKSAPAEKVSIAAYKFRLSVVILLLSIAFQGFMAAYAKYIATETAAADSVQLYSVANSLFLILILLYSARILQKISGEKTETNYEK